ncbi:hypothetical protein [Brachyspira alvinipulli]|uniref:hypothetical protein n=1 Tax=Brachyspira alvinipulli TaxID=84379 RepID=UPI000484D675|nr:hypothetical protein [Brachyspira alvinipulli]
MKKIILIIIFIIFLISCSNKKTYYEMLINIHTKTHIFESLISTNKQNTKTIENITYIFHTIKNIKAHYKVSVTAYYLDFVKIIISNHLRKNIINKDRTLWTLKKYITKNIHYISKHINNNELVMIKHKLLE